MEVDLSVTPFRRWKKCHFNSNPNRRFSSAASSGGHGSGSQWPGTLSNKSLGDFVRPRKLDLVLKVYPEDMPLLTFCQMDPNTINIEDEHLREKVIVALHAARACCVNFEVSYYIVTSARLGSLDYNFYCQFFLVFALLCLVVLCNRTLRL